MFPVRHSGDSEQLQKLNPSIFLTTNFTVDYRSFASCRTLNISIKHLPNSCQQRFSQLGTRYFARNIRFGENERLAWNENNAFIGAAAGTRRQVVYRRFRDVNSDDGKITGRELKNVRTATSGNKNLQGENSVSVKFKFSLKIKRIRTLSKQNQ